MACADVMLAVAWSSLNSFPYTDHSSTAGKALWAGNR